MRSSRLVIFLCTWGWKFRLTAFFCVWDWRPRLEAGIWSEDLRHRRSASGLALGELHMSVQLVQCASSERKTAF